MNDFFLNHRSVLVSCELFDGIKPDEIETMMGCLSTTAMRYRKGALVLRAGKPVISLGILLEGQLSASRTDWDGNRNLIRKITPGETFAETYACVPGTILAADVTADMQSEVLWANMSRVMTTCTQACPRHVTMIRHLVTTLARKGLFLSDRLTDIGKRTTRAKLLSYLSGCARRALSNQFDISLDRQGLADYLCVDRSAMSYELSKLRAEGIIDFQKNHFTIR